MTLEGEQKHEDDASPRSKTSGTDSFLEELEEEGRRLEASLREGADLIAAAVAGASDESSAAHQHQLGKHLPRARGLASFSVGTPFHVKATRHGSMCPPWSAWAA